MPELQRVLGKQLAESNVVLPAFFFCWGMMVGVETDWGSLRGELLYRARDGIICRRAGNTVLLTGTR